MAIKTNEPRPKKDNDFGIPPQAEFKPLARRGMSGWGIALIVLGIMLTAGAGIGYWFLYSATSDQEQDEMSTSDLSYVHKAYEDFGTEEPDAVAEQPLPEEKIEVSPVVAMQPKEGTITRVSTPQGFYYVVVGSFIDEDLAADHAAALVKKGLHVTIIAPPADGHFFRVAIECENTFYEACDKLTEHRATYGPRVWLLKH